MIDTSKVPELLGFADLPPCRAPLGDCAVLLVDAQMRLVPAIRHADAVVSAMHRLLRGADLLTVPVIATEHCPEAIGGTVEPLGSHLGRARVVSKRSFDAMAEAGVRAALDRFGPSVVVVAGVEAHVCVAQTALGLLETGLRVFVAEDACGSRRDHDRDAGLARLRAAGCIPVTVEALLFEWLGHADNPAFRDVLAIIKEAR